MFTLVALYFKTMVDAMSLVRPTNRLTGVGNVLFTIIPLFNFVYWFIVYPRICDSIKKEYGELGLKEDGDFGRSLAVTLGILNCVNLIPLLNILSSITTLVLWIIFWVKIDGYKKELEKHNSRGFGEKVAISTSSDILD